MILYGNMFPQKGGSYEITNQYMYDQQHLPKQCCDESQTNHDEECDYKKFEEIFDFDDMSEFFKTEKQKADTKIPFSDKSEAPADKRKKSSPVISDTTKLLHAYMLYKSITN